VAIYDPSNLSLVGLLTSLVLLATLIRHHLVVVPRRDARTRSLRFCFLAFGEPAARVKLLNQKPLVFLINLHRMVVAEVLVTCLAAAGGREDHDRRRLAKLKYAGGYSEYPIKSGNNSPHSNPTDIS
jgi:hypothetical protein